MTIMFRPSPKMWNLLKCGFLVLLAVNIFVTVLPMLQTIFEGYGPDMLDLFGENVSGDHDPSENEKLTRQMIREDATFCLLKFVKRVGNEENKATALSHLHTDLSNKTKNKFLQSSIFKALAKFNHLLASLSIKAAVIEPSVLYCMLSPVHQELLERRNFNVTNFLGSQNIITFGILQQDAHTLQQGENIRKFQESSFHPHFVRIPVADWMQKSKAKTKCESFTSHIFYMHENYYFHLVVFHYRGNYLWHAALDQSDSLTVSPNNDLLFVNYSGAYEKFIGVSVMDRWNSFGKFYIPSNPQHFLFEMLSSRFLECNNSRAANMTGGKHSPKTHTGLSVERFNKRTLVVIHQLKTILQPLLMNFWIWSGTMLGWYRQCDIIPYTTDVDFAAWASEVEDLDAILHSLRHNEYVTIKMRMGKLEEALEFQLDCFKLRTDIFFMYRVQNGSWCAGHSHKEGYYFRYFYPHFTLCSAELLGQKVQVPCETEAVIVTEYGPHWSTPVSSWSYETSVRNRGPNMYWSEQKLKDAYKIY